MYPWLNDQKIRSVVKAHRTLQDTIDLHDLKISTQLESSLSHRSA